MENTIITKNDGTPFPTKSSALSVASRLKLEFFKVKELGDKEFVIETPKVQTQPQAPAGDEKVDASAEVQVEQSGEEPAKVKHNVTTPWKPANRSAIPERVKDPNFAYKQVNQDKTGRVRQLETEGFEVDKTISAQLEGHERFDKNLDGTHRVNELITMRIPNDRADARRKYYSDMANGAVSQDEDETGKKMNNIDGVTMYQPKEANMNNR